MWHRVYVHAECVNQAFYYVKYTYNILIKFKSHRPGFY